MGPCRTKPAGFAVFRVFNSQRLLLSVRHAATYNNREKRVVFSRFSTECLSLLSPRTKNKTCVYACVQEKFYFSPGDTGFKVFGTRFGKVGVAICWDQWFPEAARAMALQGAEVRRGSVLIGPRQSMHVGAHARRAPSGHRPLRWGLMLDCRAENERSCQAGSPTPATRRK